MRGKVVNVSVLCEKANVVNLMSKLSVQEGVKKWMIEHFVWVARAMWELK